MPRLPRCDRPGRLFHAFNRGLARRPVFESRTDIRFFLACLACAVRRGEIEILAYCILTTHFHLLVRSREGKLAEAMDRVMGAYVRYYNRSRRRDGSLFRGRYGARPVDSQRYARTVIRYIDRNAVRARLAERPWDFAYGSAWHYAREKRPPWLATAWVDYHVTEAGFAEAFRGYTAIFGGEWTRAESELVRARMRAPISRVDPLDDLVDAAPPQVLAWMRRKAALADGRPVGLPCADARSVSQAIEEERRAEARWTFRTEKGQDRDAWPAVEAYLLRRLAALGWGEIARRLAVSATMAARRGRQGEALLRAEDASAQRLARLAARILDRVHGGGSRRGGEKV